MTHEEFNELSSDLKSVSSLLEYAVNSKSDATEAMKFAQAALNASDAVNRKWMCLGSNRPSSNKPISGPIAGYQGLRVGDVRQGY